MEIHLQNSGEDFLVWRLPDGRAVLLFHKAGAEWQVSGWVAQRYIDGQWGFLCLA